MAAWDIPPVDADTRALTLQLPAQQNNAIPASTESYGDTIACANLILESLKVRVNIAQNENSWSLELEIDPTSPASFASYQFDSSPTQQTQILHIEVDLTDTRVQGMLGLREICIPTVLVENESGEWVDLSEYAPELNIFKTPILQVFLNQEMDFQPQCTVHAAYKGKSNTDVSTPQKMLEQALIELSTKPYRTLQNLHRHPNLAGKNLKYQIDGIEVTLDDLKKLDNENITTETAAIAFLNSES